MVADSVVRNIFIVDDSSIVDPVDGVVVRNVFSCVVPAVFDGSAI